MLQADYLQKSKKFSQALELLLQAAEKYETIINRVGDAQTRLDLANIYVQVAELKLVSDQNVKFNTCWYFQQALLNTSEHEKKVDICTKILLAVQEKHLKYVGHRIPLIFLVLHELRGFKEDPSTSPALQLLARAYLFVIEHTPMTLPEETIHDAYRTFWRTRAVDSFIRAAEIFSCPEEQAYSDKVVTQPPRLSEIGAKAALLRDQNTPKKKDKPKRKTLEQSLHLCSPWGGGLCLHRGFNFLRAATFIQLLPSITPKLMYFYQTGTPIYLETTPLFIIAHYLSELLPLRPKEVKGTESLAHFAYSRAYYYLKSTLVDFYDFHVFLRDLELCFKVYTHLEAWDQIFHRSISMIEVFYTCKIFFRNPTLNDNKEEHIEWYGYVRTPRDEIWEYSLNKYEKKNILLDVIGPRFNAILTEYLDTAAQHATMQDKVVKLITFPILLCLAACLTKSTNFKKLFQKQYSELAPPQLQYPREIWIRLLSLLLPGIETIKISSPHFYHTKFLEALLSFSTENLSTLKTLSIGDVSIAYATTQDKLEDSSDYVNYLLSNCGSLTKFTIAGVICTGTLLTVSQHLLALEELYLGTVLSQRAWEDEFFIVLRACPRLKKVTLNIASMNLNEKGITEIWERAPLVYQPDHPFAHIGLHSFLEYMQVVLSTRQEKSIGMDEVIATVSQTMPLTHWLPKLFETNFQPIRLKGVKALLVEDCNFAFSLVKLGSDYLKPEQKQDLEHLLHMSIAALAKASSPVVVQYFIDRLLNENIQSEKETMIGFWKVTIYRLLLHCPDYFLLELWPKLEKEPLEFRNAFLKEITSELLEKLVQYPKSYGLFQEYIVFQKAGWTPPGGININDLLKSLLMLGDVTNEVLALQISNWKKSDLLVMEGLDDYKFDQAEGLKWMDLLVTILSACGQTGKDLLTKEMKEKNGLYLVMQEPYSVGASSVQSVLDGQALEDLVVEVDKGRITGDWLQEFTRETPNLRSLTLFSDSEDDVLNGVVAVCPEIEILDVLCFNLSFRTAQTIGKLENLQDLILNGPVTDQMVAVWFKTLVNLKSLEFGPECEKHITERGLLQVIEECIPFPQQELVFDLSNWGQIFDRVRFKSKLGMIKRDQERGKKEFPISVVWQKTKSGAPWL